MANPVKLIKYTRLITYTISLLALIYAGLMGWVFFALENIDLRITATLVTGILIIIMYFGLFWVLTQTESTATKERELKNYALSALRRFFENETDPAKIIRELKDFPSEILKQMTCAFSPQKREAVIRHLATDISMIDRWMLKNPEPQAPFSGSKAEHDWVRQDDNLQDFIRVRNALKE